MAAYNGQLETVEFLANLTENPLAPQNNGLSPIHFVAQNCHLEILKFLVNLTENPMAPCNNAMTPIHYAACIGVTLEYEKSSKSAEKFFETVKFLLHFTDNPNIASNFGETPLQLTRRIGYLNAMECLKFSFLMWRRKFLKF